MYKILICADDYGLTESVNRGIEACLKAGAVRSTCIMPNTRFCSSAESLISNFPDAALGLHWTLTLGTPLLPAAQVPTLVNAKGRFHNFTEFRKRLKTGKISFNQVRRELEIQYYRLKDIIGEVEFWNTHQNVHLWPGLFQLCVNLSKSLGIQKMRSNNRVTVIDNYKIYNLRHINYWIKGMILKFWSNISKKKGVLMPDGLVAMPGSGKGKLKLEEYLERFPIPKGNNVIEATLHPADKSKHPLFGNLSQSRYQEFLIYKDPGLNRRLYDLGFECISYKDLIR